jgi:hypothetical protein
LKAVLSNHPRYAPIADSESRLAKLLSDDLRGSLGIKEPVADDLPHQFIRAAIVSLGASWLIVQSRRALLPKSVKELEIPLLGVTVLLCCLGRSQSLALTLDKHGEFLGDFISFNKGQAPLCTDQLLGILIEFHL